MTMITRAARGASAFTQSEYAPTGPLDETSFPVAPESSTSHTWADLIDDLLSIRYLADNWDDQGATAPPTALVHGAIRFAQDFQTNGIEPADRVITSVNGTIYFEWHGAGDYLEIEVTGPDMAEGRSVKSGSDETEVYHLSRRS